MDHLPLHGKFEWLAAPENLSAGQATNNGCASPSIRLNNGTITFLRGDLMDHVVIQARTVSGSSVSPIFQRQISDVAGRISACAGHPTRIFCAPVLTAQMAAPLRCSKTHAGRRQAAPREIDKLTQRSEFLSNLKCLSALR
jgi:hypothetical protein